MGVGLLQGTIGFGGREQVVRPSWSSERSLWDGRSLGPVGARVQIVVWSDFQCPACAEFVRTIEPELATRYVDQGSVRITYRDFAFLGGADVKDESVAAAGAARCAERQGKFWPYHDFLFANQAGENRGAFRRDRLLAMAAEAGLDGDAFASCLSDPRVTGAVRAETQQGRRMGISATPTVMIDGQLVEGVPNLQALIRYIDGRLAGS